MMLVERAAPVKLIFGCERQRDRLPEVRLALHQKEWQNSTRKATLLL
jgi:hypothetical protein